MEPKRLTDDDLAAIAVRAEAATPGPWTVEHEMKYDVNESTAYLSELHLAGKKETVKIYCGPGHAAPQVYDLVFLAHASAPTSPRCWPTPPRWRRKWRGCGRRWGRL